jgi:hypothetical protein
MPMLFKRNITTKAIRISGWLLWFLMRGEIVK